jgi:hypothetical protein
MTAEKQVQALGEIVATLIEAMGMMAHDMHTECNYAEHNYSDLVGHVRGVVADLTTSEANHG